MSTIERIDSIVIPDTIEPFLGYKALSLYEHETLNGWETELRSPQQSTHWPPRQRLEATCDRKLAIIFGWTAIPDSQPASLLPVSTSDIPTHVIWTNVIWTNTLYTNTTGTTTHTLDPNQWMPPSVPAPEGTHWSWEPQTNHPIVTPSCTCGIYAVNTPDQCIPYMHEPSVIAEIALWGRVIPAAKGARGQYAYPQKLLVTPDLASIGEQLSDTYQIPVEPLHKKRVPGMPTPYIPISQRTPEYTKLHSGHLFLLLVLAMIALAVTPFFTSHGIKRYIYLLNLIPALMLICALIKERKLFFT